jgi:hypothetical protein
VAEQKNKKNQRGKKKAPPLTFRSAGLFFWIIFSVLIICLFVVNWHIIRNTLKDTGVLDRLFGGGETPQTIAVPEQRDVPTPPRDNLVNRLLPESDPFLDLPAEEVEEIPGESAPEEPPQPSRERPLYFMQLDKDGIIVRTRVTRGLPVSSSPLTDVLKALLQGPTTEEQGKGLISLIPPGSRLLSVTIRGETAYISLSEEFQFNTYGAEGYAAALRQIVWSVTEFSNIKDVQILIEGRRIDYLGEGIWIGSPVSRESL